MRNLKLIFAFLITVSAFSLKAEPSTLLPNIRIEEVPGAQKISIQAIALTDDLKIRLYDNNHKIVFEETCTEAEYGKVLNFEGMAGGIYELSLETGLREIVQTIEFEEEGIALLNRRELLIPVIRSSGNHVDLTMMNKRIADVSVEIIDGSGDLVFSDELANVLKVEKRYNLAYLSRGAYSFVVKTSERTYTQLVYCR